MKRIAFVITMLLTLALSACAPLHVDPSAGSEMVMIKTMNRPEDYELEYLREPDEGPLVYETNAWWLLWRIPYQHPDLGIWLESTLPRRASAANILATVQTPWYGPILFFPTLGAVRVERVRYEVDPVRIRWRTPEEREQEIVLEPGSPDFMDDAPIIDDEDSDE